MFTMFTLTKRIPDAHDIELMGRNSRAGIERRFRATSSPTDKVGSAVERLLRKETAVAHSLLRDVA